MSDSAPRTGEAKKFAKLKVNVTTPYQKAWSACEPVKLPTSAGSTGMIRPIAIMSISVVSMMKGIAASRSLRALNSLNGVPEAFIPERYQSRIAAGWNPRICWRRT